MLKQILATTAVLALVAISVQSANAANRQLVVEQAGGSANDLLLLKKNKGIKPFLLTAPASGIATPPSGVAVGKTGGKPVSNFIVAQGSGIPTPGPAGNAGIGKPGPQTAEFVIAPGGGIPSQANGAGAGNGKGFQPLLVKTSGGIPTQVASADPGPGKPAQGAFPVIANPSAITPPAGGGGAELSAGAAAALVADPAAAAPPADAGAPAVNGSGNADAAGGDAPPAAAAPANPAPVIQTPTNLYSVLVAHGYGVEILNRDANGNLVFYVTTPGNPAEADLLLVGAQYGKVLERRHIAAYGHGYNQAAAYARRYAPTYASNDNCDHYAGY